MYSLDFNDISKKKFRKLFKKDKERHEIIMKKIEELLSNPCDYKRLRGRMFGLCRVHIDKSFVLTFRIDEKEQVIYIEDFDHHDNVYK